MQTKLVSDVVRNLQRSHRDAEHPCGNAVFLIGAGCSRSAGIPLAAEIVDECMIKLTERYSNDTVIATNPDAAFLWLKENGHIPGDIDRPNLYGYLFELHFQDPTEQQVIVLSTIEKGTKAINWSHLCLGELVRQGYIHTVLTTNFDQLALEGIIRADILPVVADGIEALARLSGKPRYPQVAYLHGSMHTYRPLNSAIAVRNTDQDLLVKGALYNILRECSLFVIVGYGGGEEGVMSLLIEAAQKLPDKVGYWTSHSPDPKCISANAEALLSKGQNKFLIVDQDADTFFAQLMAGLSIGTPDWMKFPTDSLINYSNRIILTENKDISDEIKRYRSRLANLEYCLKEKENEKLLGTIRELRLAGKHLDALELLRQFDSSTDPTIWVMRANSAYEVGQYHPGTELLAESVDALHKVLGLMTREGTPKTWAMAQNNLGNSLRLLGEREGTVIRLEEAAKAYLAALSEYKRQEMPLEWACAQSNLGNILAIIGRQDTGPERLEEAVAVYREALQEYTRQRAPLEWAMTQNNLGNTLAILGTRKADNTHLQDAVQAYREALKEYTKERTPLNWAMTQTNLGNVLHALGERDAETAYLHEAILAYREALTEYSREHTPLEWAAVADNLAITLQTLGEREASSTYLEESVTAHRLALQERTRDRVPIQWATTTMNLGNALQKLGERENSTSRLEEAATAFREASTCLTQDRFPLLWATIQNNLGNTLSILGQRGEGTTQLQEAIKAHQAALAERERHLVPLDWAESQNNLGNALTILGGREPGTALLEEALAAYHAALAERTRDRFPLDWAKTQSNLGAVLSILGAKRRDIALLDEAASSFSSALEVYRSVNASFHIQRAESNLEQALLLIEEIKRTNA